MSFVRSTGLAVLAAAMSVTALTGGTPAGAHADPAASAAPAAPAAPERGKRGRDAAIQRAVDRLVSRTGLPGAIATVRGGDGKVRTYRAGAGDLRTGRPIPRDPRVRLGSNNKTFTATVVLQLVAEGRVDLAEPVETYLPGLIRGHGNNGRRITVRQLLQQTSGLPDYDSIVLEGGGTLLSMARTYVEPHELVEAALAERRHFRPGTRWEYSNTNYIVLGLLAQRITGRPIGEEIERRIIDEIGLEDTYWPETGEQGIRGRHPRGYLAEKPGDPWVDLTRMDPSFGWAAGKLVGSPRDLGRFMTALLGGELLPPAQLREMKKTVRAPHFDPGPGWRYGLGLTTRRLSCDVRGWGHGGDIQGFETRNLVTPDGRWAVVAVNGLPNTLGMVSDVNRAVDTAICRS
ncbi:serine hydrolase domain-containing protein [Nocardioides dongkuii]|uniref:serine hydrolase domain-containing protein n=1 Tax=Nocardioides dongkuii TaxID=2760089 RepID=UPI001D0C816E|nr:serine hydrolase domain-containing protein [Nocardioides dongkuii]